MTAPLIALRRQRQENQEIQTSPAYTVTQCRGRVLGWLRSDSWFCSRPPPIQLGCLDREGQFVEVVGGDLVNAVLNGL